MSIHHKQIDPDVQQSLKLFREIPGVGVSIAQDLVNLGYRKIEQLKSADPEKMYLALCDYQGVKVDRCMLYVFRLCHYYASHDIQDPEKLKWWNWKD